MSYPVRLIALAMFVAFVGGLYLFLWSAIKVATAIAIIFVLFFLSIFGPEMHRAEDSEER